MSEQNDGSRIAVFLAGLGIGAVVALLFAPKSGEETRELISQKAEKGRDYLQTRSRELRKQTADVVAKGLRTADDLVERSKDLLQKAVQ